jgi:hypothetical protein
MFNIGVRHQERLLPLSETLNGMGKDLQRLTSILTTYKLRYNSNDMLRFASTLESVTTKNTRLPFLSATVLFLYRHNIRSSATQLSVAPTLTSCMREAIRRDSVVGLRAVGTIE